MLAMHLHGVIEMHLYSLNYSIHCFYNQTARGMLYYQIRGRYGFPHQMWHGIVGMISAFLVVLMLWWSSIFSVVTHILKCSILWSVCLCLQCIKYFFLCRQNVRYSLEILLCFVVGWRFQCISCWLCRTSWRILLLLLILDILSVFWGWHNELVLWCSLCHILRWLCLQSGKVKVGIYHTLVSMFKNGGTVHDAWRGCHVFLLKLSGVFCFLFSIENTVLLTIIEWQIE